MSNIIAFHCAEAISFGAFHALGYEGYNISFGLQLSCYYLYLKATGNLEMKKIESNSSNLYLNIAILYNAYQIFRYSHTYYHRNCINKFKNVKEISFTNLLYSHCSYLLVSPTKTLYSNTQQIGIHSQITRKSLNNHLPWFTLCFSVLVHGLQDKCVVSTCVEFNLYCIMLKHFHASLTPICIIVC